MAGADPHRREDRAHDDDPVTVMLRQTGCLDVNTLLQVSSLALSLAHATDAARLTQECMFEHRDWRRCQPLVQALKQCMERAKQKPGETP